MLLLEHQGGRLVNDGKGKCRMNGIQWIGRFGSNGEESSVKWLILQHEAADIIKVGAGDRGEYVK